MFNTLWEGAKRVAPTAGIAVAAIAVYEGIGYVSNSVSNWGVADDKAPAKRNRNKKKNAAGKSKTKTKKT
jgi:hypothetical protein